jgi:protein-tyrosine phosphatase
MEKKRILPIEGAYNFRDLGGYKGANGRTVKWNTIIRASDFPNLSKADIAYLERLPLISVVDFRSEEEVNQHPDLLPDSVKNVYNFSIDAGNMIPKFESLLHEDPETILPKAIKIMSGLYRELVTIYSAQQRDFFRVLQNGDAPLLFHCAAGKDRTGVAAALLLSALGVDRDVIYEDYMLTNAALKGKYDHFKKYGSITTLFTSVKKEFLDAAFEEIEKRYTSVENYLTNELNVDLEHLRSLYLEEK